MNFNKKNEAEKSEPEMTIEIPTINPSKSTKSNAKHKQVFTDRI